jgi:ATP-binding cassette, subfamily B, bacterial PglK
MLIYFKQIFYLLGKDRHKLPILVIIFLTVSILDLLGLGLIGPYVALLLDPQGVNGTLRPILEWTGMPMEQHSILKVLGLVLCLIFLFKAVSSIVIQWVIVSFSQRQQFRLRSFLMQSYQSMSYPDYLQRNSSEYVHGIQTLTGYFSSVLVMILQLTSNGIVALVIFSFLAWTNGFALAFLMGIFGTMIFVYDRIFSKKLKSYGNLSNSANIEMIKGTHEGIEGLKEIRVLGNEKYFYDKVLAGAKDEMKLNIRLLVTQGAPRNLMELMMVTFIVLLVFAMMRMGENLTFIVTTISVFGVATLRLMPSMSVFSGGLVFLRFSRDHISRLFKDLEQLHQMNSEIQIKRETNSASAKALPELFRLLELKRLGFRYPNVQHDALEEITLQIRAGESVGLVGPSGSGKTTLVDVLLGLLEPQTGKINYNGRPLQEALPDWHAQAAYIPQQVFLIDNTLKRNVALGVEDAQIDDTLLYEALRKARLSELLEELPNGIETLLGERGIRLSGGQRQRVALARAFYHRRSVLVMDEATSALDHDTEKQIVDEIQHLKGKITMIVIAHRLTTVRHCDHIFRLEKGRVVEEGIPEKIL